MRRRHPKKEVEAAVREAEKAGWTVTLNRRGYRWGVMKCGEASRSGCRESIWSTPRDPVNHAKRLRRVIKRCPHGWNRPD
ncbi:MAG: hypothetical protein OXU63_08345 [Acidobacteriota bacterium]|nr:hypothetical protein [Acidobacteriota bacterium]